MISRPSDILRGDFLALWINSEFGKGSVLRAQGGLAQQHFNVSDLSKLMLAVPSLPEQDRILEGLATIQARIEKEVQTLGKLSSIKQGLRQDLLTGRVRVTTLKEMSR